MIKRKVLLVVVCAICFVAIEARAEQLIEISSQLMVAGPDILLKDITANPYLLPEGWGERKIMPSPDYGQRTEHSLFSIAHALQKYSDMNDVFLHGPSRISVRRTGTGVGSEKIIEAVRDFIRSDDRWDDGMIDVQFEPIAEPFHIPPESETKIEIVSSNPQREANRYRFEIALITTENEEKSVIPVYARIVPMQEVWVTKRSMRAGHFLQNDEIEPKLVTADASSGYVLTSELVEGMELIRPVGINQPLVSRFLVEPVYARRGDIVDVVANHGAITVAARAKALSTGRRGDYILCVNEISNRRLRVRLTGMKEAQIDMRESAR